MLLDIEKIEQLIEMMVRNDLVEISLRNGEEEVNLRRPQVVVNASSGLATFAHPVEQIGATSLPASHPAPSKEEPAESDDQGLVPISSPMVGTCYTASDPDSPPFVQVGSSIQPETVVCILEAMKVFNEIKAEVAGLVERVLVKNAQAVEYGQPLFLVRPQ